jgi:transcriptional regulator with XRE-family HTH domain
LTTAIIDAIFVRVVGLNFSTYMTIPGVKVMPRIRTRMPRDGVLREVARNLNRLIVEKGWNQSELARQAAMHMRDRKFNRDLVSSYCRGQSLPTPVHLLAMAKALGVEPKDIVSVRNYPDAEDSSPPWDLRNLGDGTAWLAINMAVPLPQALKIIELIEGSSGSDSSLSLP